MKTLNFIAIKRLKIVLLVLFMSIVSLNAAPSFEEKEISQVGWEVVYVESLYDAQSDTTVFYYSLNVQSWEKDLSHWVIGINLNEVPKGSGLDTSFGLDPTTGLYGFKWDDGQDKGTVATYTITVNGNVSAVATKYTVKGGTYYATGDTMGPGDAVVEADTYSITGMAYVDANLNGLYDANEPLLEGVSVNLLNEAGEIKATVISNSDGLYIFDGLNNGSYGVMIPQTTDTDDFNDMLSNYFTSWNSLNNLSLSGNNIENIDFGFTLNTYMVISDLTSGDPDGNGVTLEGTGKTIGYWKHQLSVAMRGKGRAHIDAATMRVYINMIESLYLAVPFVFDASDLFGSAFSVLKSTSSEGVDLLKKQLLGTEFNHAAGLGLVGDYVALQGVLIAYGEYLVLNYEVFDRAILIQAKDVFDLINNSGE